MALNAAQVPALMLAMLTASVPARAQSASAFIPFGAQTQAPRGFVAMCADNPSACESPTSAPRIVAGLMTYGQSDRMRTLRQVNRFVNTHVRQRYDRQVYGTAELWRASGTNPGASGDCEDIALEKRARLIGLGFEPDRLFLAVVYNRGVGLHTILLARTEHGDFILDSLAGRVTSWADSNYRWVTVQSPEDPNLWYAVARAPLPKGATTRLETAQSALPSQPNS